MTTNSPTSPSESSPEGTSSNFIRTMIREDLASGKHQGVVTRFPPEPNGYLHIGHAKSICLNFGLAQEFNGRCHMRFDDTNPTKEDQEYVDAILADIRWLGFDWGEHLYYASDYFGQMYEIAIALIKQGKAYVDSLSKEQLREYRGKLGEPGTPSPYRDRSVEENLELFEGMKAGKYANGEHVLRAKIDMSASNMVMRDPLLYRIINAPHHRTGDTWCIYPMYDFAHPLEDTIEHITHSLCSLEFENNRELYDWVVAHSGLPAVPRQTEFARLNLTYTVMSKRKLLRLVQEGHVSGWDDPRMPTVAGLRRRGVTPESIQTFAERIGVARANSTVELEFLESTIRDDLNHRARRVLAVLNPLKVVITNYPEDKVEQLDAPYWPHDIDHEGSRALPFSRELYIEREDFMEHPPKKWHRLAPGGEVRLRHGYIIKCDEVVRDDKGQIIELHCTYDDDTRSGEDGGVSRKVKGTIHWVSAQHALKAPVRLYDRLFGVERPDADAERDFLELINPESLITIDAMVEPSLKDEPAGTRFQFERQGYFIIDVKDSADGAPVFNRIVSLKDTWGKQQAKNEPAPTPAPAPVATPKAADDDADAKARPHKKTRAQERQENRDQDPSLAARYERYQQELGLSEDDADVLSGDLALASFYEAALDSAHVPKDELTKWIINELMREIKDTPVAELPFDGPTFAQLVAMVEDKTISGVIAKEILTEMVASGKHPEAIVEARGLKQINDPAKLIPIIDELIANHPDNVQGYREGKTKLLGFFVGQTMQATGGKANPKLTKELLLERLDA